MLCCVGKREIALCETVVAGRLRLSGHPPFAAKVRHVVCNISEQQVQLFVREKLEEGLGHHSIRDILAVLRMVMAYGAHRNGTALPSCKYVYLLPKSEGIYRR